MKERERQIAAEHRRNRYAVGDIEELMANDDAAAEQVEQVNYRDTYSATVTRTAFLESLDRERALFATGYKSLDKAISGWDGGGIPAGLYVVGAVSSLGKTTFLLQMADQMATAGTDVLIVSLEMSEMELIGKSISRITFLNAKKAEADGHTASIDERAFTWGDIRDFRMKVNKNKLSEQSRELIVSAAAEYYEKIAPHLFIMEGEICGTSIVKIEERIEQHKKNTGVSPVVIIDYLQMVDPPEMFANATDKSKTDSVIRACKCLSRKYETPVVVISSYNRESYYKPVSLTSNKESGSIEYSADVVIGLQYSKLAEAVRAESDTKKKEQTGVDMERAIKQENEREVELLILKNRSGCMKDTPKFTFYAKYNYFAENVVSMATPATVEKVSLKKRR